MKFCVAIAIRENQSRIGSSRHPGASPVIAPTPKSLCSLSTAAPASTITAANKVKQVINGTAGGKTPTLTSRHGVYDHFTPKEKVQIGKRAGNLEYGLPTCSSTTHSISHICLSHSPIRHSDATLVGVANCVTTAFSTKIYF